MNAFFLRCSRNTILLVALVCALLIGGIDFFAAPDLLIIYLAPIFFASWYGGRRVGNVVGIYCAGAGYVTDAITAEVGIVNVTSLYTLVARLIMFIVLSRILSKLRDSREQQQEMTNFIVHDLRSPISSSITGLMTLEQSGEHLGELEKEMVNLALVSNQRALALVNSLLDVAKLESGKMGIRRETIKAAQLIDDAFALVALWAQGNGVELVKDVQTTTVNVDPTLTIRVLVNLLSNALKYSPAGSKVTVRAELAAKDGIRISVIDQGQGIPADFVDSMFEPFSQAKGAKGGTGLGLTFCRLAVQAQGGKIGVESHVGRGTTMFFTLPNLATKALEAAEPDTRKS